MKCKKQLIELSSGDRAFYFIINFIMLLIFLIVLYPLIYVLSSSFSAPSAVMTGKVFLWPVEFSLEGYDAVFKERNVFVGYYNSLRYMVIGTFVNVAANDRRIPFVP
jgi:ABC-type glycerol-3-phosphate transport system permease component